ncbi:MAG: U32 family peptidase [Cetobacterium sp.]|uniref:peptidase U32 family protein n=1 Tax=Cetobacterium sp. TaxID=2071632 RepID=UPI002FC81221
MNIIAPAGNFERFYAAIKAGADEIYMGIKGFGARRNADNFTLTEYKEAIDYAHERGTKVLLTLNTVMMDNEIEALYMNLKALYEHGLDAVIVQDMGFFKFVKENFPNLEIHGSTQMTVANHVEANYLKSIGFSRVVLPREMSYEEIKSIREKTDIELEIFVSGSICISYSGNCYMSSFIGGRSGNRGMCAQPCRKTYKTEDGEEGYLLSPKDQFLGFEEVQKLKEIGVESIKLEGRMKDPNYVFETVSYYKSLIAGVDKEERTSSLFNRGYAKGYFSENRDDLMNSNYASSLGKNIGIVFGKELELEDRVVLGDGILYLSKDFEKLGGGYINKIEIKGKNGFSKEANVGDTIILLQPPKGAKYVFKSYAKEVNDDVESSMKKADKLLDIDMKFEARVGKKAKLEITAINNRNEKVVIDIETENNIELAQKKSTTEEVVKEKLSENGDTTFWAKDIQVTLDENCFIPLSVIKSLKREGTEKLKIKLIESYKRVAPTKQFILTSKEIIVKDPIFSAIVSNKEQEEVLRELGIKKIYQKGYDVAREGNLNEIDLSSKLATNLYQILENNNSMVTLGWNLNITNRYALYQLETIKNLDTVILSPELSYNRIKEIGETRVKKAILGYSRPRGMYIELPLFKNKCEVIENEQGDKFTAIQNELGNTEIYLAKPLNILNDRKYLSEIGISEIVMEFTFENAEEIKEVVERLGVYEAYNYEKGVF